MLLPLYIAIRKLTTAKNRLCKPKNRLVIGRTIAIVTQYFASEKVCQLAKKKYGKSMAK